jgi:hypothetical protein
MIILFYGLSFSTTLTGSFSKPKPPTGNTEWPRHINVRSIFLHQLNLQKIILSF